MHRNYVLNSLTSNSITSINLLSCNTSKRKMESLYSLILWDKMKRLPSDCEIHNMSHEEIEQDFNKYLQEVGSAQFKKDVLENSFLDVKPNDLYYDGQFYEYTDSFHVDHIKEDSESIGRKLVTQIYHETMVESTVLTLMMEHLDPQTTASLSRIHALWYNKQQEEKNGTSS
jgi:hypothetical protein